MHLEHVKFSFEVQLVTDAHVGDGRRTTMSALRPRHQVEEADSEVATIIRDYRGRPTLPSTALKGALRKANLHHMSADEVDRFFGSVKSAEEGAMGLFALYAGEWDASQSPGAGSLPYWDGEKSSWIATRVAISREHGAVEHMKLFNMEMMPAGGVFRVSGVWFGSLEAAETNLPRLLAPFALDAGLSVGAGTRLGQGAVRFKRREGQLFLNVTRFVAETGEVETKAVSRPLTIRPPVKVETSATLSLFCQGPFLSVDPSMLKGANSTNRINALKRDDDTPVLHLSSIAGAIRSRAAWISACRGFGEDNRFRKPGSWSHVSELTPVERLFGVGGWRGLLRLSQPEMIAARAHRDLTSIAIDRFSGAVIDAALFAYEVFTGVELTVTLTLERRCAKDGTEVPQEIDLQLYDALLSDLEGDVLMLGHATNRGFGWFDVQSVKRSEAA